MDDLIIAIQQKDFVKVKQLFSEQMKAKVEKVTEERRLEITSNVMVEGESKEDDDSDDDDEPDEGDSKGKEGK